MKMTMDCLLMRFRRVDGQTQPRRVCAKFAVDTLCMVPMLIPMRKARQLGLEPLESVGSLEVEAFGGQNILLVQLEPCIVTVLDDEGSVFKTGVMGVFARPDTDSETEEMSDFVTVDSPAPPTTPPKQGASFQTLDMSPIRDGDDDRNTSVIGLPGLSILGVSLDTRTRRLYSMKLRV